MHRFRIHMMPVQMKYVVAFTCFALLFMSAVQPMVSFSNKSIVLLQAAEENNENKHRHFESFEEDELEDMMLLSGIRLYINPNQTKPSGSIEFAWLHNRIITPPPETPLI